jgi:hypothetical protein
LRATPTELSQTPPPTPLPTSANLLVPPCTARTAIAAVITAAACTAISTAVVLFPLRDRVVFTCRLQFRLFRLFCLSAAVGVRRFSYVVRSVSPPLVSCSTTCKPVRAQLLRAAQDQTRSSLAPRSPLPSPLLNSPPSREGGSCHYPGSKAGIDESTACIATNHYTCRCFPLCR